LHYLVITRGTADADIPVSECRPHLAYTFQRHVEDVCCKCRVTAIGKVNEAVNVELRRQFRAVS
jgi:hypothetical protein